MLNKASDGGEYWTGGMVIPEGRHMGYLLLLIGIGKGFLQAVQFLEKDTVLIMSLCYLPGSVRGNLNPNVLLRSVISLALL